MNQFRRFMYGRYGLDQLSRALVIICMLFTLISSFTRFIPLYLLAYIPLIYAVYRMFSRNIPARTRENQIYCQMTGSLRKRFTNLRLLCVGTKTHKYYLCSHCRQIIRVPRDKGKICITCPKCRREFVKRT